MGNRAGYSWMSTNVGLVTAAGFRTPSPSATARTKCVLPAPSGPTRPTTAPGNSREPSRRPSDWVPARSGTSIANGAGIVVSEPDAQARGSTWPTSNPSLARRAHRELGFLVCLRRLGAQKRRDEVVDFAVEHVADLGGLRVGADVLDHRVGLHDVVANLVAPGDFALLVVLLLDL